MSGLRSLDAIPILVFASWLFGMGTSSEDLAGETGNRGDGSACVQPAAKDWN